MFINKIINETAYGKFLQINVDVQPQGTRVSMVCHFILPVMVSSFNGSLNDVVSYRGVDCTIDYETYFNERMQFYVNDIDRMFINAMSNFYKGVNGTQVVLTVNTKNPIFEI